MAYRDVVLADTPVEYWEFNEASGTTADSVGSGNHDATVTGATVVAGRVGNARQFDGVDDVVTATNVTDFMSDGTYSVECWFKWDNTGNEYPTFIRRDGNGKVFIIRGRGAALSDRAGLIETYVSGRTVWSTTRYDDNQWHHVVVTVSGTTVRMFIDNVEAGWANGTVTTGGTGSTPATYIGRGSGTGEHFKGSLDEFAIYDKTLTTTDIAEHYAAGNVSPNITLDVATATSSANGIAPTVTAGGKIVALTEDGTRTTGGSTTFNASGTTASVRPVVSEDMYVRFDQNSIADGATPTISKALLKVRLAGVGTTGQVEVYPLGQPTQSKVYWANGTPVGTEHTFDVTGAITTVSGSTRQIVLTGKPGDGGWVTFNTTEVATAGYRPVLEVFYTLPAINSDHTVATATTSIASIEPVVETINPVHAEVMVSSATSSTRAYDAAFEEIRTAVLTPTSDVFRVQGGETWTEGGVSLDVNYNPAVNNSSVVVPQGTAAQKAMVNKALERIDFPLSLLVPGLQAAGKTSIPVTWAELGTGESGGVVNGEFNSSGIVLDLGLESNDPLVVEEMGNVLAHEIAHAVDVYYLTNAMRVSIWNALHDGTANDLASGTTVTNGVALSHGHYWLGGGDYFDRVGEAFANAFVRSYSDFLVSTNAYTHPATVAVGASIRNIITPGRASLNGTLPARTPAARFHFGALPGALVTGTIKSATLRLNVKWNTGGSWSIQTLSPNTGYYGTPDLVSTTLNTGVNNIDISSILDPHAFNTIHIGSGSTSSQELTVSALEDDAGTEPTLTVQYVVAQGATLVDVATATTSTGANEPIVETIVVPDAFVDLATAAVSTTGSVSADASIPVVVNADNNDGLTLDAHDVTIEINTNAHIDLDSPSIQIPRPRLTDVNGLPIVPSENEDEYFNSTWRTLRGVRRAISGGQAGQNQDTAIDESIAYWFRFNERSGSQALDRAYALDDQGVKQGQAVLNLSNVGVGLNDGPDSRHNFHFNGDAYAEQPGQWGKDEIFYAPTSLEFTIRTERKTQFLMGGSDQVYGLWTQNAPPWELWLVDGRLELRQFNWDRTINTTLTVRGRTDIADGAWHHIVLQNSHEGSMSVDRQTTYFAFETYVDARLEIRRRTGAVAQGFPDFIGGRPHNYYTGYPGPVEAAPLAKSHWFKGDLTELVFRNGRVINDDEMALQRDNVMGILAVRPDPARATIKANEALVKGNKPRVLVLDFAASRREEVTLATFSVGNQAHTTESLMQYGNDSVIDANSFVTAFPGYGDTEIVNYPSFPEGGALWFRKKVYGYFDEVTDNQRLIDLNSDLNMDDYDLITIIGYPNGPLAWGLYNELDAANAEPMVPMRVQLEHLMNQVKAQVVDKRKSLYITDPGSAIALGIVGKVDYVPRFEERVSLDRRLGAQTGLMDWHSLITDPFNGAKPDVPEARQPDKTKGNLENELLAARYEDTHFNVKQRVRNAIDGLTTIPAWVKTDEIRWWNINPMGSPPFHTSRRYEQQPFGLEAGKDFFMEGGMHNEIDTPYARMLDRMHGWIATPMSAIKVGKAVTTFSPSFFASPMQPGRVLNDEGNLIISGPAYDPDKAIGNPYQDHAISIAVEPGDTWDGKRVSGKVYVNFTEARVHNPEGWKHEYIQAWTHMGHGGLLGQSLNLGDVITFADGGQWTIESKHMHYQFSTHYGSHTGSEVNLPDTGGSGADWGWSPGGTRGGSGGTGAGHAMQWRWRSFTPLVPIPVPTMANRALKWLITDLEVDGNTRISVADAEATAQANDVVVETSKNTEVNLSTARVTVENYNDADTVSPDVTVLVPTVSVTVRANQPVEEIQVSTARSRVFTSEPQFTSYLEYGEAVTLTLPRQILTLTLEEG